MFDYTTDSEPIYVQLPNEVVAIVDVADADLLEVRWHLSTEGYAQRKVPKGTKQTTQYMQRVVLSRMLGRDLDTKEIADHINGNRLDNRRSNIRLCASAGNTQHRKVAITSKTGYKGVTQQRTRFVANIVAHGKHYYLGSFGTPEEAARAYDAKAREVHGDFAWTNFK